MPMAVGQRDSGFVNLGSKAKELLASEELIRKQKKAVSSCSQFLRQKEAESGRQGAQSATIPHSITFMVPIYSSTDRGLYIQ